MTTRAPGDPMLSSGGLAMGRRRLLSLAQAGVLATIAGAAGRSAAAAGSVTFLTYGGLYGDNQKKAMVEPFTTATGIAVDMVSGKDAIPALIGDVRQSTPTHDVIALADLELYTAIQQGGLLAPLDVGALSNLADLPPVAKAMPHAVNVEFDPWGIMYRTDKMEKPTSWRAVLEPASPGRTAFQRPTAGSGTFYNLIAAAMAAGGTQADVLTKGLPKIKALRGSGAQFVDFGASLTLLQNDSIDLAPMYNNEAFFLADQGLPVDFAFPSEGVFPIGVWLAMPTNIPAERKAVAMRFIDHMISASPQVAMARLMYTGPTNLRAELEPALAARVLTGATIDRAAELDWPDLVRNQQAWLDAWNREIAG